MVAARIWHPLFLVLLQVLLATCLKKSSLTFVIDDTDSMRLFMTKLKNLSIEIMDRTLATRNAQTEDIVVATFNDPGSKLWVKSKNRTEIVRKINSIRAYTTKFINPCPEDAMGGILLGLNNSLPGSSIYVYTDSEAQDQHLESSVIELCQRTRSSVTFLTVQTDCIYFPTEELQVYMRIANACYGKVMHAPPNEIEQFMEVVNIPQNEMTAPITIMTTKELRHILLGKYQFVIEAEYEYFTVTVMGQAKSIDIYLNDEKVELKKHIIFKHTSELRVDKPQIGNYTVEVRSHLAITITVSKKIIFTFDYGFSQQEPKIISETTKQLSKDTNNFLSILTSGTADAVSVEDAEILNMDDEPIKQIPLNNKGGNFYTTAPFQLPVPPFKIAVNGVLKESGRGISRITEVL